MSLKKNKELKALQNRQVKLEVDVVEAKQDLVEKQEAYRKVLLRLKDIKKRVEDMQDVDVVISDHAIVRYMERAMGLDVEQIASQIFNKDTLASIESLGDGKYPICEGLQAVVKNNTVVTIM